MAEEAKKNEDEQAPQTNSMAAFSTQMKDLEEALALLYITKNPSGRLKFKEKWPEVADHLFGSELIKYDIDGVEDREHRAKLEDEANDRRIDLKATIAEIVDKSVQSGSLLFDYVGSVIDLYGPTMSTYLYAEDVIERVRPGVLKAREEKAAEPADSAEEKKPSVGDDMSDTTNISAISDELNMEKDDMTETGTIDEDQDTVAEEMDSKEGHASEDEKLSSEEKTILSNAPEIPEEAEDTEALLPDNHVPDDVHQPEAKRTLPPAPQKEETPPEVKPIETPSPSHVEPSKTQAPPLPPEPDVQTVKPIETPTPALPEAEKPAESNELRQAATNPAPPVSDVPDILKPPPAETQAPPLPEEPKKVEELTAPQAAKAEKGVYKTMFNGLAKAV